MPLPTTPEPIESLHEQVTRLSKSSDPTERAQARLLILQNPRA